MIETLGFGCATLSSMKSSSLVSKLLHAVYDTGITHFDTAPLYGQGFSEKLLGNFISNKRDRVTITTKFGLGNCPPSKIPAFIALPLNYYRKKLQSAPSHGAQTNNPEVSATFQPGQLKRISKKEIESSLSNSLLRLNTDYIDYYLLHENIPSSLETGALDYLLELKQRGIVHKLGIGSNISIIENLNDSEIANWQILQYEYIETKAGMIQQKYPGKEHFIHSCLKQLDNSSRYSNTPSKERAGHILADCAKANKRGKVLFSTRNITRLKENMNSFHKYY